MKRNIFFIFIPVIIHSVLCGCGKTPPERIESVCRIPLGEKSEFKVEKRARYGIFGKHEVLLETHCTPLSFLIWKVDMIFTDISAGEVYDALRESWQTSFTSGQNCCELPGSTVKITPDYTHGPSALKVSVTDRKAAAIYQTENSSPQAEKNRKLYSCQRDIALIEEALEHFFTDTEMYPRVLPELRENILLRPKWDGPYLDNIPADPWGKKFHYRTAADGKSYELYSRGENGTDKIR